MAYTIKNNFQAYKADFKKDTGLEFSQNLNEYLAYYNARCSDTSMQLLSVLLNEVGNWRYENESKGMSGNQVLNKILEELKNKK